MVYKCQFCGGLWATYGRSRAGSIAWYGEKPCTCEPHIRLSQLLVNTNIPALLPLTEADVRRIVREELKSNASYTSPDTQARIPEGKDL